MEINFSEFKDLHFVNFEPQAVDLINKKCQDKIKIISSKPSIKEYHNVVYSPSKFPLKTGKIVNTDDFLYQDNQIIEASSYKRGGKYLGKPEIDYSESEIDYDDRSMLYLGHVINHYGHFLLEGLSRLWCFTEFSNIRNEFDYYLIHVSDKEYFNKKYVSQLLGFLGIELEKIIWFDKLTKIKSVTIPEVSMSLNSFAYTIFPKIFTPIHNKFDKVKQTSQPLYLSRRLFKNKHGRNISNEDELENFLLKNGFHVVHPQYLPLEEQMYLMNRHKYIVGPRGSALHSILFSPNIKTTIHICSCEEYLIKELPLTVNFFLIDRCCESKSFHLNVLKTLKTYELKKKIHDFNRSHPLKIMKKIHLLNENCYKDFVQIEVLSDEFKKMGLIR